MVTASTSYQPDMNVKIFTVMHMVSFALLVTARHNFIATHSIMDKWELFKIKYSKKYSNRDEEKFRLKIFMENTRKIAEHNERYESGEVHFKMGMNKYGDMLTQELAFSSAGCLTTSETRQTSIVLTGAARGATFISPANVVLPHSVDWRDLGAVTPVGDQGRCSSCWAFSATGALEGQMFRKTKKLVALSEQNLIDCTQRYGNQGCSGGSMNLAFLYVSENRGLDTDEFYPYTGHDGQCQYDPKGAGASAVGYVVLRRNSEKQLKEAVATVGPVSVFLASGHDSFHFYKKGVYFEPQCRDNTTEPHHAALVVGYGTDGSGRDYWILKNSWGTSWGQGGYMFITRDGTSHCGIATAASYPLV